MSRLGSRPAIGTLRDTVPEPDAPVVPCRPPALAAETRDTRPPPDGDVLQGGRVVRPIPETYVLVSPYLPWESGPHNPFPFKRFFPRYQCQSVTRELSLCCSPQTNTSLGPRL